jgi:hypothetical protein
MSQSIRIFALVNFGVDWSMQVFKMMPSTRRFALATVENRIQKLEDRAELQDLVATYFQATDDDDYDRLSACFTSDAIFAASGFSASSGRSGIIDLLKSARAGMGQTVHTPNYVQIIFGDSDSASGVVAAHLELGIGEVTYYGAVRYVDEYRRENARWCIARREMRVIHIAPWSEVEQSLSSPLNIRWAGSEPTASDFPRQSK